MFSPHQVQYRPRHRASQPFNRELRVAFPWSWGPVQVIGGQSCSGVMLPERCLCFPFSPNNLLFIKKKGISAFLCSPRKALGSKPQQCTHRPTQLWLQKLDRLFTLQNPSAPSPAVRHMGQENISKRKTAKRPTPMHGGPSQTWALIILPLPALAPSQFPLGRAGSRQSHKF